MIWKSILTTVLLITTYTLFINYYGQSIDRTAQTTGQRNLVKAEDYLYEASDHCDTILIGSSMSERLRAERLAPHCYNLSFSGLSALDGLYLIERSGHVPKVLFVEINSIAREVPVSLDMATITDSSGRRLKQWFPFLRQKYQPVGVLKALLRDWQSGPDGTAEAIAAARPDTALQQKMVQQLYNVMRLPLSPTATANSFRKAKAYLSRLQRRGTTVILFEMPINSRLENLLAPQTTRQYADAYFPAPAYQHIALPADSFRTSDGIHLLYDESLRYSNYLHTQYQQLAHATTRNMISNRRAGYETTN